MRILVAEDDPVVSCLLADLLAQWGYTVDAVADGREARQLLLGPDAPQLAILDWMLPGVDGPDICSAVRAREQQAYVYILMLTAKTAKAELIAALEAGADDYLVKPFDAYELKARLMAGRRILDLQDRLQNLVLALEHQALHDPLTGLWNRGAVLQDLDHQLARTRRENVPVSILLVDLDHFKAINDTYGHAAGDVVLREAARRMQASLRPYDGIGRYGGEEFLIVLPGCNADTTLVLGDRLRDAVGHSPMPISDARVRVTLSGGIATLGPDSAADRDTMLQRADAALYRAKDAGRNRIIAFK